MGKITDAIFNKGNLVMLIILVLGIFAMFIGSVRGFEHICGFYGTIPKYNTLFSSRECKEEFTPNVCFLPTPDLESCDFNGSDEFKK